MIMSTFTLHFNPHPTDEASSVSYVPYITQKTIELTSTTFKATQSLFTINGHTYHLGPATLNPSASAAPSMSGVRPSLAEGAGAAIAVPKLAIAAVAGLVGVGAALL